MRTVVPLKAMCSRKWAVPLLAAFSYRLPASIQTPTVAVSAKGVVSDATLSPLDRVVTCSSIGSQQTKEPMLMQHESGHAFTHTINRVLGNLHAM